MVENEYQARKKMKSVRTRIAGAMADVLIRIVDVIFREEKNNDRCSHPDLTRK